MDIVGLNRQIEKKRKHLVDLILRKSTPLSDRDIVKISTELDELIALFLIQIDEGKIYNKRKENESNSENI